MPSTYAHYRFGQDVLRALPEKYRTTLLQEEDLFNIGLHGPDLLFYYKPFSHHPLHAEGGRMHHAYLCGFLCHFALDCACHGYINDLAARGEVSHEGIESEFDRILLEEDGIDPIRRNLAAHIHASRRAANVIAPYFPGAVKKEIHQGIRSLHDFNVLLALPGRIGYRQVDRILQRLPSYDFIHGHMINIDPDPLCEQSNLDLRRMYESAIADAVLLIRRFLPAVHGKKPWPALMDHDFESC